MDDSNATPIDKLPTPTMQMKSDMPKLEAQSYQDMVRDLDARKNDFQNSPDTAAMYAQHSPPPPPPPTHRQQQHFQQQQQHYDDQYDDDDQSRYYSPPPPQQQQQQQQQQQRYMPSHQQLSVSPSPPPPQSFYKKLWTQHKLALIVALIIIAVLWVAIPKLKTMPRFSHDTMGNGVSLNTLGTMTTALGGAVAFKIASSIA